MNKNDTANLAVSFFVFALYAIGNGNKFRGEKFGNFQLQSEPFNEFKMHIH